jgi:hypothetical protein
MDDLMTAVKIWWRTLYAGGLLTLVWHVAGVSPGPEWGTVLEVLG